MTIGRQPIQPNNTKHPSPQKKSISYYILFIDYVLVSWNTRNRKRCQSIAREITLTQRGTEETHPEALIVSKPLTALIWFNLCTITFVARMTDMEIFQLHFIRTLLKLFPLNLIIVWCKMNKSTNAPSLLWIIQDAIWYSYDFIVAYLAWFFSINS